MSENLTYKDAGVDIDAGNELVRRISAATKATHRPEILSKLGGFAALARLPDKYRQPLLVTGTDGVGTKLRLAIDTNQHAGVGQDLVAMCVNDVLVTGAEPLLFLDYYASAKLDVDVAERVIKGIAKACEMSGCALVGGETAEMPGMYHRGDYDLAGFCVAVVEQEEVIDGSLITTGDQLIGLSSSGPHSNGYSLIRRVLKQAQLAPDDPLVGALLTPTRVYVKSILALLDSAPIKATSGVHGMVHITGGGFNENIPRMFVQQPLKARIDLDAWQRPEVFSWLQRAGNITEAEMLRTFNCGIGFVVCVAKDQADECVAHLRSLGEQAQIIGEIVSPDTCARAGQLIV